VFDVNPAPPEERAQPPPNFWPMSIVAKQLECWMDQDATLYGGKPWPRRRCVRWGHNFSPLKGAQPPPQFSFHVYCGQMAGWMKTPLGMEVDLGRGHIVLRRGPSSPTERHSSPPPLVGPCLLWSRLPISATTELL